MFLLLLQTVAEHGRDLPQKLSRRNVILTNPRVNTEICGLQVAKLLNRDFRWTSVLAAELCQQSAYLVTQVFCGIAFSRWVLFAEDLESVYWSPLHGSVVHYLSTRLLTLEVRSIHCLENFGQRTPGDGAQQAYPRRTSSPQHRFESRKYRIVILLETDLLIRFLLVYILCTIV